MHVSRNFLKSLFLNSLYFFPQPGAFFLLILVLVAVPFSRGIPSGELNINGTEDDSLLRFIAEQPPRNSGTEDKSTLTDVAVRIKRSCTYTEKDACQGSLTQALQYITDPGNKKKCCKIIPKCRCAPLGCATCIYRQN